MRRTLAWAFAISFLIHVWLLLPLGNLLLLDEPLPPPQLKAQLLPPPAPKAAARPKPRPKPAATESVRPAPTPQTPPPPEVPPPPSPEVETPVLATGFTGSGQIEFEVSKGEERFVLGRALHTWRVTAEQYQLDSEIRATGLIALFTDVQLSQHSHGRVNGDTLMPEAFVDVRKDRRYRAFFFWSRGVIELDRERQQTLPEGTQDLISLLYQLGRLALDADSITVPVTNARKLGAYTFTIRMEPVALADASTHPAYHLHYQGEDGEGLEVWLADAPGRLPLRVRYLDRKGGMTELLAVRYPQPEQEPKP